MQKSFLFRVHSYVGLISGAFILILSVSGAALVFHEDIDQLRTPLIKNQNGTPVNIHQLYQTIRQQYPKARISHCELPDMAAKPVVFSMYDSGYLNGSAAMQLYLDPTSGQVLKTRGTAGDMRNNFMGWLAAFHSSFKLGKPGEWLLGLFAVAFLLSIVTGIVLYRKKMVSVLLFRRKVFKRRNLHQIIGVYALLFNLMIAVTGFWMQRYVFKKEFYISGSYAPVLKASQPLPFDFDSAYKTLKKGYPDFTAAVIYFAQSNKGKTAIYGSRSSNAYIHSKKMADAIFLDSTGSVSKTRFINEIEAADRYDIINSQLHMGKFGGTGIKVIYFVFGLTGALLSITGFLLWLRRRKHKIDCR